MWNKGVKLALSPRDLSREIIKAALRVHSTLGPGQLENADEVSLAYELRKSGFGVKTQVELPVM